MKGISAIVVFSLAALSTGCGTTVPTDPSPNPISVSVMPAGGATNVDPAAAVSVTFGHPMHANAADYIAMHDGDIGGPMVPGHWEWSADGTHCQFVPDQPLHSGHSYTIHLGGGVTDMHGHGLDFQRLENHMGGHWGTAGTMGGHTMQDGGHGWHHPNGSSGMGFRFTTR